MKSSASFRPCAPASAAWSLCALFTMAMAPWPAIAGQIENMMSFQARLTDDNGEALADGRHTLDFFIYDAESGGTLIGSILNVDVTLSGGSGVVSQPIGPVQESWFNDAPRFLGLTIDDNDDNPAGDELSPRIRLTAVPYAMRAFNLPTTANMVIQTASIGGNLHVNGNIGVGTPSPDFRMTIRAPGLAPAQFLGTGRGGIGVLSDGSNLASYDFASTAFDDHPLARIAAAIDHNGSGTSKLLFGTSNNLNSGVTNSAMVIDEIGRVGIGTGSPVTTLHLAHPAGDPCTWGDGHIALSGDEGDGFLLVGVKDQGGAFLQAHGPSGRPLSLNPCGDPVVVGNTINPTKRFVVGTTQMDIDRMPFVSEAIVVGTHFSDASTSTGLFFEAGSRSSGGIVVEKMNSGGNEDSRMRFYLVRDGFVQAQEHMTISENGYVGISTTDPQDRLDVNGTTRTKVLTITGGSDLAEPFTVSDSVNSIGLIESGMVVTIDPHNPGELNLSTGPYDRKVAGIISGANGLAPGMVMKAEGTPMADGEHNVALTGRVWCWCDASNGAIAPGDRLTTSATLGHAMKVTDESRAPGSVIGKAMTPLADGRGMVLVLVNLQ